jgi:hypothetical protein
MIFDIKTSNKNDWFIMILINIFYSDCHRILKDIKDDMRWIINDIDEICKRIPIELLLMKFLKMENNIDLYKINSIDYISNIYDLFEINQMNLYEIDGKFYMNLNKCYKYYYNNYKGIVDIVKTWKFDIGDIKEDIKKPSIIIIHFNTNDILRDISLKYNKIFDFDEYKDFINYYDDIYQLKTMIYKKDEDYFILFTKDNKKFIFDFGKKELKEFDWNSRVIMFHSKKILMTYSNS